MKTPIFLTIEEVLEIHENQIQVFGGTLGVRARGELESAIGMPSSGFDDKYFHGSLFLMAAAYLYHITKNHPFVDGNKRTGAVSAFTFLQLNGLDLNAPDEKFYDLVIGVAENTYEKADIAEFFEQYCSP